jgi:hypothetical protein
MVLPDSTNRREGRSLRLLEAASGYTEVKG